MPRTEVTGSQIKDGSVSLTADVTGILPVGNGGTGSNTLALNNVLLGNGNGALQAVAPGTAGNVLTSNGSTWVSAPAVGEVTLTGSQTLSNKTLTTPRIGTSLLDVNGNTILGFSPVASPVNYVNIRNSVTTSAPRIEPIGSDTNISIAVTTKGSGIVYLSPGSLPTLEAHPVTSSVNYLRVFGAATGNDPTINANGSDTNVNLNLTTKGTGVVEANGVPVVTTTGTQALTNKNLTGAGNTFPTFNQNTTGNAATATALQTARTINGVSFNGTANITVADSTKEPVITAGTTAQYWRGDKTWQTLNSSAVGLGNVNNTSDANKPVSTATQTALNLKEDTANKGVANGYASLDTNGKVPGAQLPNSIMTYQGLHNASTNSPALTDAGGAAGQVYRISVAGTRDYGSGNVELAVGDYLIHNGTTWEKADTTDAVSTVAGKTGNVTLVKGDVGLGSVDNTADSAKNVLSATKLTTARTIGGVSFDGTANINLPGVNAAGNQNTTGSAATLTTARTIALSGAVTGTATSFNGSANITIPTTVSATQGGVIYGSSATAYASTAAGTAGQLLVSGGTGAPTWVANDLTAFPSSAFKKSVRAATTANITLSGTQTIDGVALVAGDRVLVKDQSTASQNGIYVVSASTWTRPPDADSPGDIAAAFVNVEQGTANGGQSFTNVFRGTDTTGTTAMPWYRNYSTLDATTTNTADKLVLRTSNGDIFCRYGETTYVSMSHSAAARNSDTVFYSSTDNYIRKNTAAGFKTALALNNVDNTSDATKNSATATLTNKTIELPGPASLYSTDASLTNITLFPDSTAGRFPVFSPVAKFLWHNLLAFNRWWGAPTYETFNGTTWSSATLDASLFDGKEANGVNLVNGTTGTGVRWTWNSGSVSHSYVRWWVIGLTYVGATNPINTYLIESSTDGVTWTTRHTSTFTGQASPLWLSNTSFGGDSRIRLTITTTNAQPIGISTIKALSPRWGNQGGGSELEFPYDWDSARRITIANGGANARSDGALNIGATSATTAADGIFFGSDVNLYRSAANTLTTDDALIVGTRLETTEVRTSNGTQLVLNGGDSSGVATGQTGEIVYVNAEGGLQVNSSPDNWGGGWAARKTATICDSSGNSSFPGSISATSLAGSIATGSGASGTWGISITGSSASTTGNAATATKLATARTISLTGPVTGSVSFDGSGNASMTTTIGTSNADNYANIRVLRNSNTTALADGMFIGYGNGNSGITRLYGGGDINNPISVSSGSLTVPGAIYSTRSTASGLSTFSTATAVLGNIHMQNPAGSNASDQNQAAITFGGGGTAAQAGIYVLNNNTNGTSMGFATTNSYSTGPQLFLTASNTGVVNFPRALPQFNGVNLVDLSSTQTLTNKTLGASSFSGDLTSTTGVGVRLSHTNQTDSNDGLIAAGRFGEGLNIVGVQTVASGGRKILIYGQLNNSNGSQYVTTTDTQTLTNKTLTSPTLTSPALGTPASGNLANCTFPTLNQSTTGSAATLTTARTIALSGAATGTATSFNGSANITIPVTALNATDLTAGTVPDARLSGTYSGFSHKIDGSNTVFTTPNSGSSNTSGRTVYGLAEYRSNSSAQIGAIVFIAPNTTSSIMHQFELQGLLYNQNIVRLTVQGYRTTGVWNDTRKISFGTVDIQTRWGVTPDGKNCLILGDVGTSWSYPHLSIVRAMFSHTGVADAYCSGWTVAVVTDLSAYTNVTATIADSVLTGSVSGNAATATTLQTARTINGVSFNGSANITLPTVNTSGNQTIDGAKTFTSQIRTVAQASSWLGGVTGNSALTLTNTGDAGTSYFGWVSQRTAGGGYTLGILNNSVYLNWFTNAQIDAGTNSPLNVMRFESNGDFYAAGAGVATRFVSSVATGTAPLTVSSTTAVTNLNADLLDGNHASAFQTLIAAGTTAQYWRGDKTWQTLNATAVGLGNVTNVAASTTATASSIAQRDANKNLLADNFLATATSTATAAGTTTLNISATATQIFTGTTTQTVRLPTTSILAGQTYTIINNSTGAVTVQSSAGNTITAQAAGRVGVYTAMINTPTSDAHWVGTTLAAGKVFKATNDLTLSGTDGTTFTFPSATGTVLTADSTATVSNKNFTGSGNTWPTFNQSTTGSAATLTTARTFQTNLASTATASFNGSANVTPGVTGTLPIANGGTGATTAAGIKTNLAITLSDVANSTTLAQGVGSIELGHASDTTISRSEAGVIAVEGNRVMMARPRVGTIASTATPSINCDTTDVYTITALAAAITSVTVTGTPTDGQRLTVRIKDNGTARAIAWGASFIASGVAPLLTTTVASKTHLCSFVYDSAVADWVAVATDDVGY